MSGRHPPHTYAHTSTASQKRLHSPSTPTVMFWTSLGCCGNRRVDVSPESWRVLQKKSLVPGQLLWLSDLPPPFPSWLVRAPERQQMAASGGRRAAVLAVSPGQHGARSTVQPPSPAEGPQLIVNSFNHELKNPEPSPPDRRSHP